MLGFIDTIKASNPSET